MNRERETRTFFRQSGWMVAASTFSGVFMYATHFVAQAKMSQSEYGLFGTLLGTLSLLGIPTIGIQILFTRQFAVAVTDEERRRAANVARTFLVGFLFLWLALASVVLMQRQAIAEMWRLPRLTGLWITVLAALPALWLPVVSGILQGQQDFLWLGWSAITNGVGRFVVAAVAVALLTAESTGAMGGVIAGMVVGLAIGVWKTPEIWRSGPIDLAWKSALADAMPLTLGLGTVQLMMWLDLQIVKARFHDEAVGAYAAAETVARGIIFFTGPIVAVMLPKIARSKAMASGSNALSITLLATAVLGGAAALACTIVPELPFRIVNPSYVWIAPLLPLFAWCMLPIIFSTVLLGNFMARAEYKIVPWLVLLAAAYAGTLSYAIPYEPTAGANTPEAMLGFRFVVKIIGLFNLGFLGILVWWELRGRALRREVGTA